MSYQYPAVGAFYNNDCCTFTVWAPLVKSISVLLKDRSQKHTLQKDERGCWSVTVNQVKPGERYLYQLNDDKEFPDPASRWQPDGVHGSSAIPDPNFTWDDENWKGISTEEIILYELHVGTFSNEGTFAGVIEKLPYLCDLGVNAIEIMPIAQFSGSRNWGYDGVYPFAVQHNYGGIQGLKQLVNEAHKHGIAVILDVVYNHLGPEGNYLSEFAPYFTDKYKTVWGSAINFDDAWCDGVRNYYWQNALMWLDEFHIDGLRLDAVHAIWDFSAHHFIKELKSKVSELEEQTGSKKLLIAEFDLNDPKYIDQKSKGGFGLDAQWVDEFHHAIHALITGEVNGYYEDFGRGEHLAKSLKDSYVYTGQYSQHRKKNFGASPAEHPYNQFIVFAQNHDQIGNRLLGERLSTQLSYEAQKLIAAALLLSPHIPMLFMGEEYGEKNPFQYFISHEDNELVELVRKGRKTEFSHFNWNDEIPDPASENTFNQCMLNWSEENTRNTLFSFYKYLINFRKQRPAMRGTERNTVEVFPVFDDKVISFERKFDNDAILIVLNFDNKPVQYSFATPGVFSKIFDSSSSLWDGPGESNIVTAHNQSVLINAESAAIFELQ